jgi:Fungal specific transcription factor domain
VYPHLRVSRHLILKLLQGPVHCKSTDDQDLKGFILETYAYLVLVANITPYGEVQERTLPLDNFVTSLEPLQQYSTFGTFFGCGYWLFEKIADISRLSMQRLEEERIGKSSRESLSTYETLLSSLNDWEPNVLELDIHPWEAKKAIAGEVYRHSILIYLKSSMCGSVIDNPKVICEIQSHIDAGLELLLNLDDSPYGTIMLWPIMIMGSCLIKLDQRLLLDGYCQKSKFQMSHVSKAADLLRLVWGDSDRRAYGPYGLHFIMEKHAMNFCMA